MVRSRHCTGCECEYNGPTPSYRRRAHTAMPCRPACTCLLEQQLLQAYKSIREGFENRGGGTLSMIIDYVIGCDRANI